MGRSSKSKSAMQERARILSLSRQQNNQEKHSFLKKDGWTVARTDPSQNKRVYKTPEGGQFANLSDAIEHQDQREMSKNFLCDVCSVELVPDPSALGLNSDPLLCDTCKNETSDFDSDMSDSDSEDGDYTETVQVSEDIPEGFYLFYSEQVLDFLDQINSVSRCATLDCNGLLNVVKVVTGHGPGSLTARIACSGCSNRQLTLTTEKQVPGSRRCLTSTAVSLSFLATGNTHSVYKKTLGRYRDFLFRSKLSLGLTARALRIYANVTMGIYSR